MWLAVPLLLSEELHSFAFGVEGMCRSDLWLAGMLCDALDDDRNEHELGNESGLRLQ